MRVRVEPMHEILSRVDPARMRAGWPVGLRDGALLALLAAGLAPEEICRLRASAVTMNRGKLLIEVHRRGVIWYAALPADLAGRVLVWLTECRLWAEAVPVFTGAAGAALPEEHLHDSQTLPAPEEGLPVQVALYARTSAADRETVEQILAGLAAHAACSGWEVALECSDPGPWPEGPRTGRRSLLEAVRAQAVQGILVRTLSHLAHSLRHLTDLGHLLAGQDVALIAIEERLDTTDPGGAIRWRDWLEISGCLDRSLRSEAAKLARLRTPGNSWGRPTSIVNPLELLTWWEGRGGRRPLSLRELALKLDVSEATARKRLRALQTAGEVNERARARALAARGGLRKGGRPANPLDDVVLAAAWRKAPNVAAVARHLHVSRSRVRSRLQELGLLPQSPGSAG